MVERDPYKRARLDGDSLEAGAAFVERFKGIPCLVCGVELGEVGEFGLSVNVRDGVVTAVAAMHLTCTARTFGVSIEEGQSRFAVELATSSVGVPSRGERGRS